MEPAMQIPDELDELRVSIERIRTLLENLVVRGLRACGPDELAQLDSFSEHLEQTGAGCLASGLADLRRQIESDDRGSARTLLQTQINVRLLERLLTLRVVKGHYAAAELAERAGPSAETAQDDRIEDEE
jgi:hypothetical protein